MSLPHCLWSPPPAGPRPGLWSGPPGPPPGEPEKPAVHNKEPVRTDFEKISIKQAKLGVPHSKSKLSGQNQIHLASWSLPDF